MRYFNLCKRLIMPKVNLYVRLFIHIHFLERFQIDAFSANTLSLSRIEILHAISHSGSPRDAFWALHFRNDILWFFCYHKRYLIKEEQKVWARARSIVKLFGLQDCLDCIFRIKVYVLHIIFLYIAHQI